MESETDLRRLLGIPDAIWLGQVTIDMTRSELGVGSDATVYRTTYNGQLVATKVIHRSLIAPENTARQAFIRRFGEECLRLRQLSHPSVVNFIGVGQAPNSCPCLVLELMEASLAQRINVSPPDPFQQTLSYLIDMAAGLRYLHWQGIVHRDLKPQNILICAGAAKIADVGMARTLHGDMVVPQQRMTRCPGTPNYMPPESLVEGAAYDQSLDIFACGVIILAMFTNKEPAPKIHELHHTADGRITALSEIERRRDDLALMAKNHPARQLVLACMSDNPKSRPTATDFYHALRRIQKNFIDTDKIVLASEIADHVANLTVVKKDLTPTRQQLVFLRQEIAGLRATLQERDSELSELREEVRAQGLQMVDIVSTVEGLRRALDRQQTRGRLSPRGEASEAETFGRHKPGFSAGDNVVFKYDSQNNVYRAVGSGQQTSYPAYLHERCYSRLGIDLRGEKIKRPPIVAGVVEDRELIEVRKIPNRYGVAVGTRLYRLRVLPMDGDQLEVTRPDL